MHISIPITDPNDVALVQHLLDQGYKVTVYIYA